jgi:hypothetical protein
MMGHDSRRRDGINLIGFLARALLLAALALCVWGGWAAMRDGPATAPAFAVARIGAAAARYDPAYGRSAADRAGGELAELNLVARFPGFAPAGADDGAAPASLVFARLDPADSTLAPEERMAKLYVRFLEPNEWIVPGGLTMRRFQAGSPYEREELYYVPPEGRVFATRCTRPGLAADGLPETCLRDFRVRGVDAQIRFSTDLLPQWEALDAGARGLVEAVVR